MLYSSIESRLYINNEVLTCGKQPVFSKLTKFFTFCIRVIKTSVVKNKYCPLHFDVSQHCEIAVEQWEALRSSETDLKHFNPFPANVTVIQKPGFYMSGSLS